MLILAVDTATTVASVALVEGERLVAEEVLNIPQKTHSERLLPVLVRILAGTGVEIEQVDGIAVSAGPGSFTGLRIGLGTGKGLAQALNKPLVTVPTLDALAYNYYFPETLVCPLLDAKQGYIYTALYWGGKAGLERLTDYLALTPEELTGYLEGRDEPVIFLGDGIDLCGAAVSKLQGRAFLVPEASRLPRASSVAFLGRQALAENPGGVPLTAQPLYVRKSAAEINLEKKRAQLRRG
ncbi:MAG TPA: tRNA (adenosine(37)-N6)-threonylcarbamoyltransferase complex dimerization subunit type 1 TsaB [Firmicutes bacterium]|jgi:tRNA threonylcarbamoyladenosine biosynthesis protein TsaB|nr:tRNA (adenosine(37)-N6)-threonylcarbamoyltransferase complex dimerization subunit type 1 TsaB [Bacillota bacterium]